MRVSFVSGKRRETRGSQRVTVHNRSLTSRNLQEDSSSQNSGTMDLVPDLFPFIWVT